ncbi:META domain-containing protein [Microterricola viridarii]|uniref:META domain-containing protein n=1 Tax=Microterricola viridarii TaxID=412690 RepID=A0A1H1LJ16_9MICO|nr:META domain-containing protein [Microterricola viridarii]SDR74506.1 META domain-containing protein [Microterricola viridarii]
MTSTLPRHSSGRRTVGARAGRTRAAVVIAVAAVAALGLSGCANSGAGTPGGPDPVGTWGTVDTTGVPFLTFSDDGSFTGSDGCNTLNGGWQLDGTTIDFENVATTLKACEGVDTWLSALNTATIEGTTMTVFNDADAEIGTLDNADSSNGGY